MSCSIILTQALKEAQLTFSKNEYFSCESLGGEKQREDATGECAEKRTQCHAPLAVNSVANFNHHKLDIAVPA